MQDIDVETMEANSLSPFPSLPDLPKGWRVARLGELWDRKVLSIKNGYAQGGFNEDGQGVPHLRPFNVTNDGILDLSQVKYVEPPSSSLYWMRHGDIIFNNTNTEELVGKTAFFDLKGDFVLSNHMTIIRVSEGQEEIDAFWLSRYLHYLWMRGLFHDICRRHVNQASVGLQRLRELSLLIPPLPEQRAIAHALRTVQSAREARRREAALERDRKAALMQRLFTKGTRGEPTKVTEIGEVPMSWEPCELRSLAQITYGLTVNGSRRKSSQFAPYLTVANVTRGDLRLDEVKQIGMLPGDSENYKLIGGDVLFVEGNGNPKLLGSAAVWNDELPFVLHQNHLIRARPYKEKVLPEWIMSYVNSDDGRAQILGKTKTSSGLHTINSRIVGSLQIPVPPLSEQRTIAEVLRACDDKIAALEREAAAHDELFKALLDELMTGQRRMAVAEEA